MYTPVSKEVRKIATSMMIADMTKEKALEIINSDPEAASQFLKEYADAMKKGLSASEIAITAGAGKTVLYTVFTVLGLLGSAQAADDFSLKLRRSPSTMQSIEQMAQEAASKAKQELRDNISKIKTEAKKIQEKKGPILPGPQKKLLGGKTYSISTYGQAEIFKLAVNVDNQMKDMVSSGNLSSSERASHINDIVEAAGITVAQ